MSCCACCILMILGGCVLFDGCLPYGMVVVYIDKNERRKIMRISQQWSSYNQRRYGRPWIAKITSWPIGGKPDVEWGRYVGDANGGEVEIEAQPGDIVRAGQKDNRGGNTSADWYIVQANGSLDGIDAAGARKAWDARQADKAINNPPMDISAVSDDDLIAEIKRRGIIQL